MNRVSMDVTAIGSFPQVTPAPCAHCGDPCGPGLIVSAGRDFCCLGCEAVFALLHQAGLGGFYSCAPNPGVSQKLTADRQPLRFAVLDDVSVAERFISFNDGMVARVTFTVPNIHCASCVWLLEQLWRFDRGIVRAEVDLLRRAVRVEFRPGATSLRRVAEVLASLGYEPAISPEDAPAAAPSGRRRLQLQIGVAGFAFGNIMLFSIPRYANGAPLEPEFQRLFNLLNVALATPVLIFSAAPYFRAAWESLRARAMAIEVPVALGLMVLFVRSLVDIETGHGEGFLDSFAGLVFFLLLGRLLQHKVFDRIAFDRTYRAFLPLSVRVQQDGGFSLVPLDAVAAGDCIEIRPGEIVPADARLLSADGQVDYAFVTGEEAPVAIRRGAVVRAGGRGVSRTMRLEVVREVSQSHLASLWGNPIFAKPKSRWLTDVGARFGAWFTVGAVALAAAGAVAWWPDAGASARVATAVLIIACPCALTLSAPVTLGTAMGLLGSRGLFLKHPAVALDLSRVDVIAFDKTGTLTSSHDRQVIESAGLDAGGWLLVRELARHSTHPVSRTIASWLDSRSMTEGMTVSGVVEVAGVGIAGWVDGTRVAIGHVDAQGQKANDRTPITVGDERGWVRVVEPIRPGVASAAHALARAHDLHLLSGDQDAARSRWRGVFGSQMRFRQTPQDKLEFIAEKQNDGHHVLMIGDGLNDAGALAAADVGIAVSDETACMVPACDAVIAGDRVADLPVFLRYVRRARSVVLACLLVSAIYNAAGLTLALRGALTPLASAILMPLSSLTVVGLSWGAMQWSARRMLPS